MEASLISCARLAAIVELSDDAIISKDLTSSRPYRVPSACSAIRPGAVGKPVTILIPPYRIDEELGYWARFRRGERIDHYEGAPAKDGSRSNLLTVSDPTTSGVGDRA